MKTLYESDFFRWTQQVAQGLRSGRVEPGDLAAIAEEIEALGISTYRELRNRMAVLLAHMLKWDKQPALRSKSWDLTVREQRRQVQKLLEKNPSLRGQLDEVIADAYESAVYQAILDTGVDESAFPPQCPYSNEAITG